MGVNQIIATLLLDASNQEILSLGQRKLIHLQNCELFASLI